MENLILCASLLFLIACNGNVKLTTKMLFKSRQNVFIHGSMISLIMNDRWRKNIELIEFDKEGNQDDRIRCMTDPVTIISCLNDSILSVVYNVGIYDRFSENSLKNWQIKLKNIKVEAQVIHDCYGGKSGNDFYYDPFKMDKRKNLIDFFLENRLVVSLKPSELVSAFGHLKSIEFKNDGKRICETTQHSDNKNGI